MAKTRRVSFQFDKELSPAAAKALNKQGMDMTRKLVERLTPWLVEVGSWSFGGMIAINLFVIAALITVKPVDPAITIAATAFALALPLDVAGLFLLRLIQDKRHAGFDEEWAQVLQELSLPVEAQAAAPKARETRQKRRTGVVLGYAFGVLVLSGLLTVTGMIAALWHIAWWIGVAFLAMSLIGQGIVIAALVTLEPSDSPEKQEYMKHLWEEMLKQAKEQSQKNDERA